MAASMHEWRHGAREWRCGGDNTAAIRALQPPAIRARSPVAAAPATSRIPSSVFGLRLYRVEFAAPAGSAESPLPVAIRGQKHDEAVVPRNEWQYVGR